MNELKDYAWYIENANGETHDVMTRKPNELGIFDMSGNVWEWCKDNSTQGSSARVRRGGGWNTYAWACEVACRDFGNPINRDKNIGFRLALVQK